ncbi:MAG TPA: PAS domain S-box protein, partial [Micavibrio sp.]|nr:PAS domain S-box protein [Micavibrio sp.]
MDHKLLFDHMPVPRIIVRHVDGRFKVVDLNQKACEFFGRSESEVLGQTMRSLLDNENAEHIVHSLTVSVKRQKPVTIQSLPTFPGNAQVPGFWINPVIENGEVTLLDIIAQPVLTDDSVLQRERDDALLL